MKRLRLHCPVSQDTEKEDYVVSRQMVEGEPASPASEPTSRSAHKRRRPGASPSNQHFLPFLRHETGERGRAREHVPPPSAAVTRMRAPHGTEAWRNTGQSPPTPSASDGLRSNTILGDQQPAFRPRRPLPNPVSKLRRRAHQQH